MWKRLVDSALRVMSRWSWTTPLSHRLRWKLEESGFFSIYDRLVVVCGMARTGTSATTAYIGSHPDVTLVVNGHTWYRAENELILGDVDWETIDGLLRDHRPNIVLLKRPWLDRNEDFFRRAPEAKVVVCFRDPETLFLSWNVSHMAGTQGRKDPQGLYDEHLQFSKRRVEEGALRMDMEALGVHQASRLGQFLKLSPEGFDPARIERRWFGLQERPWLEENAIWLNGDDERYNHSDSVSGRHSEDAGCVPAGDTAVYEN
jgi:hypothetical protein